MTVFHEPMKVARGDELNKTTIGNSGKPRKNPHRGNDWSGTGLITAITTGRVSKKGFSNEIGNFVIQKTAEPGLFIGYYHLEAPSSRAVGDMVVGGETVVGKAGNTGSYSFGVHLHAVAAYSSMPHLAAQNKLVDLFDLIDKSKPKADKVVLEDKPKTLSKKPAAKKKATK